MKGISKKAVLMLLALVFLMGSFSLPAITYAADSLIPNGGFEDGLSGWSWRGEVGAGRQLVTDPEIAHTDNNCVKYTPFGAAWGTEGVIYKFPEGALPVEGQRYLMTAWVKRAGTGNPVVEIKGVKGFEDPGAATITLTDDTWTRITTDVVYKYKDDGANNGVQLLVGVKNPNQKPGDGRFLDETIAIYVDDISMVPYEAFEDEIYTRNFNLEEAKKLGEDNNYIQAIKAGTDPGAFDGTNFFDLEMKAGAANSWPFLTIDGFGSPAGEVVFEGMFNTTYTGDKTDRLAELHYGFQMPGSDKISRVILSRINKDSVMDHANKPVASNTPGQWLKIKVTINTYKGTYQISVYDKDGALLGENKAQNMPAITDPANFSYAKASVVDARYMTASDVGAMHLSIDNLTITKVGLKPAAPVVSNVVLSGKAVEEQTLRVTYKYLDDNGDPEDTDKTEINWYRADSADAADWGSAVATGSEYVLTGADIGKYIKASVKAYATQPPEESNLVETEVIGPILAKPNLDNEKITTLDLTKTTSMLMLDAEDAAMTVFGSSDNGEYELTDTGRLTYASSDEYVLTVANDGKISIKNPGYAIVTGTYTNPDNSTASAKIVLNIAKDTPKLEGFESYTIPSPELNTHLTLVDDPVRSGEKAMAYRKKPASGSTTANWGLDSYTNYSNPSAIGEVWFYDSGEKSNAKASAYFQAHDRDPANNPFPNNMAVRIGILDDSKDYYMYFNSKSGRNNVGPGAENLTDTDKAGTGYLGDKYTDSNVLLDGKNGTPAIPRSKGWHQAVLVVNGGNRPQPCGYRPGYHHAVPGRCGNLY